MTPEEKSKEITARMNPAMTNLIEEYGRLYAKQEAIGFAEWADNKYFRLGDTNKWTDNPLGDEPIPEFTTEQLYNLYQQEKQKT